MHFLIRETLSFNLMYVAACYPVGTTISKTSWLFTALLQLYAVALFMLENLKALSRNKILTSNKGHDSNKQKITGNNSHLDLVNMNAYIKFCEFCQFVLKILSWNEILA